MKGERGSLEAPGNGNRAEGRWSRAGLLWNESGAQDCR